MDCRESAVQIGAQRLEGTRERAAPRDQHVVMIGPRIKIFRKPQGFLEAPAQPVSLDRAAGLARRREADSRPWRQRFAALGRLQHKRLVLPATAASDALVFGPLLQTAKERRLAASARIQPVGGLNLAHRTLCGAKGVQKRRAGSESGGQALAAARPTSGDDLAAADRLHARPKAVPALANELARLIGPLHGQISKTSWSRGAPRGSRSIAKPRFSPRARVKRRGKPGK